MLLSVDFDFFVREEEAWDWGHNESPFFRDSIWPIREISFPGDLKAEMDPRTHAYPKPWNFWDSLELLGLNFRGAEVIVADSHRFGYESFQKFSASRRVEPTRILHFDAHADLGYHSTPAQLRSCARSRDFDCGSWLFAYLYSHKATKAHLVYPDWKGSGEAKGDLSWKKTSVAKRVTWETYGEYSRVWKPVKITGVFLCRSGSWSPPWLDFHFCNMVTQLEEKTKVQATTPFQTIEGCNPREMRSYTPWVTP